MALAAEELVTQRGGGPLPPAPRPTRRMTREEELTRHLARYMPLDVLAEFYRRFGGYRVPRRSRYLTQQLRVRILVACLVRTVNARTILSDEAASAVAEEYHLTPKAVKNTWYAWNRVGRPRLKKKGTTADATAAETFRW